jgi:hypothetical protein
LGDADVTRLFGPREPAIVREFLDALPRLERQQYIDFLTNGACRGALLCHRDIELRNCPDESVLHDCWIGLATAQRESGGSDPLIQDALSILNERRPAFVAFNDVAGTGRSATGAFIDAYAARTIDIALSPPLISGCISAHPTASPLARLQAQGGSAVTNQKCETIRLTDLARCVVTLLDGVHSADDVCAAVAQEIRAGRLADDWTVRLADVPLDARRLTADALRHLRDSALLVA